MNIINLKNGAVYLVLVAFALAGCNKIKDELFKSFTASGGSINFEIPVITSTSAYTEAGQAVSYIDLDSLIKAETSNNFGLNDIKGVYIEEARIVINNPDAANNWGNFEEGRIDFSTDSKPAKVSVATGLIEDKYAEEFKFPPVSGINLKEYLSGKVLTYELWAKMRRPTDKVLNCTLFARLRIE